jgi:hypothetical protein
MFKHKVLATYNITEAEIKPLEHFKEAERSGGIQWSIQTERTHGIPGLVKVSRTKLEDPSLSLPSTTPQYTRMAGAENLFVGTREAVKQFIKTTYPNAKRVQFV